MFWLKVIATVALLGVIVAIIGIGSWNENTDPEG